MTTQQPPQTTSPLVPNLEGVPEADSGSGRDPIPLDAVHFLATCPKAGGGVHRWIYRAALRLHKLNLRAERILELIANATQRCGRAVSHAEIEEAVQNSRPGARLTRPRSYRPWPPRNIHAIAAITQNGPGLVDLQRLSPVPAESSELRAELVIDALFPDDPLLCLASSKRVFFTRPRESWRGHEDRQQFIVPSPMSAVRGLTKTGKASNRCEANTGPRKYLVIEFDEGTLDEQAALLLHLGRSAPLALVVHSGGKSLHGWMPCETEAEPKLRRFMELAVRLGADPATWTRCQLVRLPGGLRDGDVRQRVVFFNPHILEAQ